MAESTSKPELSPEKLEAKVAGTRLQALRLMMEYHPNQPGQIPDEDNEDIKCLTMHVLIHLMEHGFSPDTDAITCVRSVMETAFVLGRSNRRPLRSTDEFIVQMRDHMTDMVKDFTKDFKARDDKPAGEDAKVDTSVHPPEMTDNLAAKDS
jgi:hypothetical protein